jgi:tRNA A-37 threonylcarbamoyl transferase component Bud32
MTDTTAQAAPLPERVGPWTVEDKIGAGGMGVVFKAQREGRTAAVKVMRPGVLDDVGTQARFAREVEVLRRVRDVHIAEFLDADLVNEPVWLATAFISGPNLRDAVAARGALPEDSWWRLARGLAQALAVLEVHGITHRDIKPANVILAAHGPVLIDFGIANPEDAASLTGTGLVTGSPAWLSPEQAELKPVSAASDVFSLGSLLAFAGTGRQPFGQGANIAVLLAIATKEPDLEGLSDGQRALVEAMMAKRAVDRPSARQVLQWTKRVGDATTGSIAAPAAAAAVAAAVAPAPDGEATTVLPGGDVPLDATRVGEPLPEPAVQPAPATEALPVPPPAAPAERRRAPRGLLWILALVVAGVLGWLAFTNLGGDDDGTDVAEPTPTPSVEPTTGPAPPPPGESQFSDGSWTLERFSINRDGEQFSISTTITNRGTEAASGNAVVFLYRDGVFAGTATGPVPVTPPGGSSEVVLTSTDPWKPGTPTVVFQMEP